MSNNNCSCNCNGGSTSGSISGNCSKTSTLRGRIYAPTYVSAYSIAVQNGFEGTEKEWLESLKGKDGKSAYQIAVDQGFEGTEDEWLESLIGPQGEDGKSAYQIAVENGYEGTEDEWIAEVEANADVLDIIRTQVDTMQSTLTKYGSKLEPIFEAENIEDESGNKHQYNLVIHEKIEDDDSDSYELQHISAADIYVICS